MLVSANFLSPLATFSRAQAGGVVSAVPDAGGVWREVGADVPQFDAAGRALFYGQVTNSQPNPRGIGAVPGSPGTLPNSMVSSLAGGITREVVGTGVTNGVQWVDLRFSGTATNTNLWANIQPLAPVGSNPATVAGQANIVSGFAALVAGSIPGAGTLNNVLAGVDSGGVGIEFLTGSFTPSALARFQGIRTPANVNTVRGQQQLWTPSGNGQTMDFTLRLGWWQHIVGTSLLPPFMVLPAAGGTGASTRGADNLRFTGAAYSSLFPTGGGSVLLRGVVIPQSAPVGVNQTILDWSDGSANNRYVLINASGGNTIQMLRVTAGVASATVTIGTMTPGVPFNCGVSVDLAAGTMAGSFNGGAESSVTGGPTSGLNTLQLGANVAILANLNGGIGSAFSLPVPLPAGQLAARVASL